jgi:hypothetical protein
MPPVGLQFTVTRYPHSRPTSYFTKMTDAICNCLFLETMASRVNRWRVLNDYTKRGEGVLFPRLFAAGIRM